MYFIYFFCFISTHIIPLNDFQHVKYNQLQEQGKEISHLINQSSFDRTGARSIVLAVLDDASFSNNVTNIRYIGNTIVYFKVNLPQQATSPSMFSKFGYLNSESKFNLA